ncbi:LysR family transcriptional regulator [Solirubrobacter sp. CPCC 204708]|uniref:LysR family transcriptional regulator n=1 Tax=Solirubrobacter deserti TaxID=2282478 RepID=A0ABT4RF48_9ACTN|nr:LysR family transcriptional regulator [Solirubrobacter deserti]MBE2318528.1 LysR family transcriptional regulator [Solirubrobacter deserti]MDA0136986.1 LysR family transcriptional regulator [Solirubrobacter deserti]
MDPRFLRTFVRVVRLGSFSAAAAELGYTQSAVSQHIAVLEGDVGVPLLTRRPVGVTEAGARLLEHAEPILLRLDAARADVARVASGPPSRLRIGATPLAATFAAELVAPALAVTVRVGARDEIARAVAVGELDAGVVDGVAAPNDPLRLPETGARVARVKEEPLAVAAPLNHPLAALSESPRGSSRARATPVLAEHPPFSAKPVPRDGGRARPATTAPRQTGRGVRLEDLVDARWIDAPAICAPLADLASLARTEGFRPALHYDGADLAGLLALVAAGHGLALLPTRALHGVAALPVIAPALTHRTEWLTDTYG